MLLSMNGFQTVSHYPGDPALEALLKEFSLDMTVSGLHQHIGHALDHGEKPHSVIQPILDRMGRLGFGSADTARLVEAVLGLWNFLAATHNRRIIH